MKKKKLICVVEDDEAYQEKIQDALSGQKHFTLFFANDGKKGLELILQKKPDLVLLDIIMPQMDGLELLQKIRDEKKIFHTPVLILTQISDPAKIALGTRLGIRGYIIKEHASGEDILKQVEKVFE